MLRSVRSEGGRRKFTILLSRGKLEQAEEYLFRALGLDPEMVEALLVMARISSLKRDYEESLMHLKAAAELRPNDPQLHYRLSETCRNPGRPADAQRELNLFRDLTARGKSRHGIRPGLHPGGDALLLGHRLPVCSLRAPCPAGAAPVSVLRGTFTTDC